MSLFPRASRYAFCFGLNFIISKVGYCSDFLGCVSIFNALAIKNKDKELKLKVCTNELKEIKDMANDVIQTVKKSKRSNTEDPAAMKSALKELHLAIETFLNKCSGNYGVDE